jgi:hypothetical protein
MPERSRGGRLPLRFWKLLVPLIRGDAVSDLTLRSRLVAARARLLGGSRVLFCSMLSAPKLPVL